MQGPPLELPRRPLLQPLACFFLLSPPSREPPADEPRRARPANQRLTPRHHRCHPDRDAVTSRYTLRKRQPDVNAPELTSAASFRQQFSSGERLIGTFVKTPTTHATEILGDLGFDFVVIDEEHAPFDRITIDAVLLAARASGIAGIVRVAEPTPARILSVLDDGASGGVLVPHVDSGAEGSGDRRRLPLSARQAWVLQLAPGRPLWRAIHLAARRRRRRRGDGDRHDRGSGSSGRHRGDRRNRWDSRLHRAR